jgi:hypothetical protein
MEKHYCKQRVIVLALQLHSLDSSTNSLRHLAIGFLMIVVMGEISRFEGGTRGAYHHQQNVGLTSDHVVLGRFVARPPEFLYSDVSSEWCNRVNTDYSRLQTSEG